MQSFGFPAFYLPPFLIYSVSCTQCRPPLSVTRLDSFPPVSYSIEVPCSLQSTAHSLCFASPIICSHSTCHLYRSTCHLSRLAQCYHATSLTSSPSTLSLLLGSPPLFQLSSCRCLYRHSGLSDRRLTYPPPPILLTVVSRFSQPSTRSLLPRYSFYLI